jgi:hypothetical protein
MFRALTVDEQIRWAGQAFELAERTKIVTKIREWLKGKKTYTTAAIGALTAVAAWADGQIGGAGLVAALWAATQTCFLRAGVANEAAKAQ